MMKTSTSLYAPHRKGWESSPFHSEENDLYALSVRTKERAVVGLEKELLDDIERTLMNLTDNQTIDIVIRATADDDDGHISICWKVKEN